MKTAGRPGELILFLGFLLLKSGREDVISLTWSIHLLLSSSNWESQQVLRCEKARCPFRSQGFKFFDREDCNLRSRWCILYKVCAHTHTHTHTSRHRAQIIRNTFAHKRSFERSTIKAALPHTEPRSSITPSLRHSITYTFKPAPSGPRPCSTQQRKKLSLKVAKTAWTKGPVFSNDEDRPDLDCSPLRQVVKWHTVNASVACRSLGIRKSLTLDSLHRRTWINVIQNKFPSYM